MNYDEYVSYCNDHQEEPLTERQFNYASSWNKIGLDGKRVSQKECIAQYTTSIRYPGDGNAILINDGDPLPWWEQPEGYLEGFLPRDKKRRLR